MPKKRDNKTRRVIQRKFCIGNAKGGVPAHTLTNARLEEILKDTNKKRDWNNARKVLSLRGVDISTLDFRLTP